MTGWQNKPFEIKAKKGGTIAFCMCGKSKNGPYCDGSHEGTGITPKVVSYDEDSMIYACGCRQSKGLPLCDGTHTTLTESTQNNTSSESAQSGLPNNTPIEPYIQYIHDLATNGLSKLGSHGQLGAMGVPRQDLPSWDDIQFVTAQLATFPLLDSDEVSSETIIGPNAKKPLKLKIPLFVSDMSFGSLSQEAKVSLSKGAELAGTGICSGEGGMLAEEQESNSHYFYELASARFGFSMDKIKK